MILAPWPLAMRKVNRERENRIEDTLSIKKFPAARGQGPAPTFCKFARECTTFAIIQLITAIIIQNVITHRSVNSTTSTFSSKLLKNLRNS